MTRVGRELERLFLAFHFSVILFRDKHDQKTDEKH